MSSHITWIIIQRRPHVYLGCFFPLCFTVVTIFLQIRNQATHWRRRSAPWKLEVQDQEESSRGCWSPVTPPSHCLAPCSFSFLIRAFKSEQVGNLKYCNIEERSRLSISGKLEIRFAFLFNYMHVFGLLKQQWRRKSENKQAACNHKKGKEVLTPEW